MTPAVFLVLVALAVVVLAGFHVTTWRESLADAVLAVGLVGVAIVVAGAAAFV